MYGEIKLTTNNIGMFIAKTSEDDSCDKTVLQAPVPLKAVLAQIAKREEKAEKKPAEKSKKKSTRSKTKKTAKAA